MAALVVCCRAGTDGAMGLFYEQQLTNGSLENWPREHTIGIDAMGKLVPAVLRVGHLVHRGKEATAQYAEIHRWVKWLLSFGVSLIFVFDGLARYPPKAARAHKERAEREKQDRADAVRLDADGDEEKADKSWIRILDRATLLDLVQFTQQLLDELSVPWVVAPYEADHQLAFLAERGQISAVHAPHNDTDLPVYGIPNVLFRLRANGEFSSLRVRESLLGKVLTRKTSTAANAADAPVDLSQVHLMDKFACSVMLGGCDYFKTKGVAAVTALQHFAECNFDLERYAIEKLHCDIDDPNDMVAKQLLAARATFAHPLAFDLEWGADGDGTLVAASLACGMADGTPPPEGMAALLETLDIPNSERLLLKDTSKCLAIAKGTLNLSNGKTINPHDHKALIRTSQALISTRNTLIHIPCSRNTLIHIP